MNDGGLLRCDKCKQMCNNDGSCPKCLTMNTLRYCSICNLLLDENDACSKCGWKWINVKKAEEIPISTPFKNPVSIPVEPFACPVCNGHGTVSRPPHIAGDIMLWSDTGVNQYECRACKGSGIIWREEIKGEIHE